MKQKDVVRCWDSNPYLAVHNPAILPTVTYLTNVSEIIKICDPTEIRNRSTACGILHSPHCLDHLFGKKIVGKQH